MSEDDQVYFCTPDERTRVVDFPFDEVRLNGEQQAADHTKNEYRAAALRFLTLLDASMAFAMSHDNPRLALWVVAMGLGRVGLTGGISQSDLAERLHVTKAAVSKSVKEFQARVGEGIGGVPAMEGQRSIDACRKAAAIRNEQLKNHNQ